MRFVAASCVTAVVAVACSSSYSAEIPADVPDATEDARAPDATADVDAGPRAFCASRSPAPTFCSDFDGDPLPAGWTEIFDYGQGSVLVDALAATSPPRSLASRFVAGPNEGAAALRKELAGVTSVFELEFDFRIDSDDGTRAILAQVDLRDAVSGRRDEVFLRYRRSTGMDLQENAQRANGTTAYASTSLLPVPPPGFAHVKMTIASTGTASSMTLAVEGATVASTTTLAHQYTSASTLALGIVYLGSATAEWQARFDNVTVNVQ
jgi:hypothetical protein